MLFDRKPLLGFRLVILGIFSVALMVWDHHGQHFAVKMRNGLSTTVTPLLYAANAPFSIFDTASKNMQTRQELIQDNTSLKAQLLLLQGQVQKLQALQTENDRLRALLQSASVMHQAKLMVAQVMAIQTNPFQQEITLNKGINDGAFVGQPVLDAHGIMGQIIDVSPFTSRLLLLTDPRSGIPIQDNRTGLHGILNGQGNTDLLSWVNVQPTADVKVGDLLTSSGVGGHYPTGYPVGTVSAVNRHTSDQFLQIDVIPSAQMTSNEQVLLVWPEEKAGP